MWGQQFEIDKIGSCCYFRLSVREDAVVEGGLVGFGFEVEQVIDLLIQFFFNVSLELNSTFVFEGWSELLIINSVNVIFVLNEEGRDRLFQEDDLFFVYFFFLEDRVVFGV